MGIKVFRIKGEYIKDKRKHPFTIEVRALNAGTATQRVFANLGSRHKLKQRSIKIQGIGEIAAKDATNLIVQQLSEE